MKLYTEDQVNKQHDFLISTFEKWEKTMSKCTYFDIIKIIELSKEDLTPIKLPSDEEIYWNDGKPSHTDNYIVHRGAEGVSLGWWNGEEWIELWGDKKLNVYGWIKIPNAPVEWMRDKIQGGNK